MSIRLLYICFCILPLYLSAQTQVLDSLLEQLPTLPVDTTKVNELVRISGQYRMINLEKAIQYGHQANRLAQRLGHDRGQAKAVYQLAIAQLDVAAYDSALYYSQQTVQWSSQLEWPFLEGLAYNLTGSIFRSRRQSDKALEAFFQSLEIGQGMGDSLGMAYALNNIANVYIDQQDSLTAAKYHREALTLARDQQDPFLESTILTNLASVSAPADRKRYLQQGLLVAEEIEALSTLVFTHNNLGGWYLNFTQQIDSARYHFQRSLDLSREVGDTYSELAALHSLANLEIRTGNLSAVNTLLATAGKLLPEAGQAEERLTHFRLSSELAARRGDYQQAFQQLERSLQWRDSLHNQQMAEAVTDATIRFETEKKETQILNQKLELARQKRRQGILILSSLLILTLLSTFFLLRYQRLRLRKKQSEEKLQFEARKAQEMADLRSRFFADIAHELRTPLTLILGPLQSAIESSQASGSTYLDLAYRQAGALQDRVNELLELTRLESSPPLLSVQPIAVDSFLKRTAEAFRSLADERGIDWRVDIQLPSDEIREIDPVPTEKVLNNLLSNALKYTPKGGQVTIQASLDAEDLQLSISDTGPGIPAQDLEHLFDRFYRRRQDESTVGTGIGLALTKELIQWMEGSIQVHSEPGTGTTFLVSIPAPLSRRKQQLPEEDPDPTVVLPAFNLKPIWGEQRPKILLVEDQPEMAEYIASLLTPNCAVQHAQNGRIALELLESYRPDLIISDISMPEMDGFAFREQLNEQADWKDLPFIYLSARTLESDRLRSIQLGVADYLLKPFLPQELKARVFHLLKNKKSRSETPTDPEPLTHGQQLVENARQTVLDNLDDPEFRVTDLAKELAQSARNLGRYLKRETGLSPVEFILEIRLQQAYQLLAEGRYPGVAAVRMEVGIESPSYFSQKFTERFGVNPSEVGKNASL